MFEINTRTLSDRLIFLEQTELVNGTFGKEESQLLAEELILIACELLDFSGSRTESDIIYNIQTLMERKRD